MYELEMAMENLLGYIPNIVKALLLFLLAWAVAVIVRNIVKKILLKLNLDKTLSKGKTPADPEYGEERVGNIAQIIYFLVFILFIPSILDALNMNSVSAPISNMMDKLLAFIPNLIGAGIIIFIGYFIAKILRDLVYSILQTVNIDKWYNKITPDLSEGETAGITQVQKNSLANVLSNILFGIVLIPVITVALETLNIATLTEPIVIVLNKVLNMIPNVFVAMILIIVGYYIAKFIGQILTSLLSRMGIQRAYSWLDDNTGPNSIPKFDLASIIGNVVKALIILFVTVEALRIIRLEVLNVIGTAIIGYVPLLLSGVIIIGLGIVGGYFVEGLIKKYSKSSFSAAIAKYIIIVFAVFMTLEQIKFASTIVNIAFLLVLGGLSVAFALAFGIGGRDFAKRQLERVEKKIEEEDNKPV